MNAPARSILLVAQLLLAACNEEDPKIVTNAMPLEVSAFQTSATPNLLFTTLTICDPTNSNCQTIDHILVDTGSGGLRIFKQALTVSLTQAINDQGAALAACEAFARGNAWGPVQMASVKLASEPAIRDSRAGDRRHVRDAAAAVSVRHRRLELADGHARQRNSRD